MDKDSPILIVGAGTFGLSAAYHLSLAGYTSITVLEKGLSVPSPLSAANDLNKIVRAEYEDPFYTDLALEAMAEWARNPVFAPHYRQTGYLLANSASAPDKSKRSLAKSLESIKAHPAWAGRLRDVRSRDDIRAVAPAFNGPMTGWVGYFNEVAGYVHSANSLRALYDAVVGMGVSVRVGYDVTKLSYDGDRCTGVVTAAGDRLSAKAVVLTLGASVAKVLPDMGKQIAAKAMSVAHVQLTPEEAASLKGIPVTYARDLGFLFEPEPGTGLLKLCPSGAGYTNNSPDGISLPPENNDFIPERDDDKMRYILQETLPHLAQRPLVDKHICWFADSADSDYVIDAVPDTSGLVVATGDSGHGFKMMPLIGKWIRDVVEKGKQDIPRWRWKQPSSGSGDISWRIGQVTDLKDVLPIKGKL